MNGSSSNALAGKREAQPISRRVSKPTSTSIVRFF
jgi:hypothetical protein